MTPSELVIRRVGEHDDLAALAASIDGDEWDEANDLDDYSEDALRQIVQSSSTVLLVAHLDGSPVGLALATKQLKPYGNHWLYVDEVDVHPAHRRRGIGRKLMESLFEYAEECDLEEVWLGAQVGNDAANALYRSLEPDDVDRVIGYTFVVKRKSDRPDQ